MCQIEVEKNGAEQNKNEFWSTPHIKESACHQNDYVFKFCRREVVNQQEYRQKEKYKKATTEYHQLSTLRQEPALSRPLNPQYLLLQRSVEVSYQPHRPFHVLLLEWRHES